MGAADRGDRAGLGESTTGAPAAARGVEAAEAPPPPTAALVLAAQERMTEPRPLLADAVLDEDEDEEEAAAAVEEELPVCTACLQFELFLLKFGLLWTLYSSTWNTALACMRFSMYCPRTEFSDLRRRFSSLTPSTREVRSSRVFWSSRT